MNKKKSKCLVVTNQIQLIHRSMLIKSSKTKQNKSIIFSVVLTPALEDFVKAYAESVHDQWSYAKVSLSLKFNMICNVIFRLNKVGYTVNKSMINIVSIQI